jgi:hypothetical protein
LGRGLRFPLLRLFQQSIGRPAERIGQPAGGGHAGNLAVNVTFQFTVA